MDCEPGTLWGLEDIMVNKNQNDVPCPHVTCSLMLVVMGNQIMAETKMKFQSVPSAVGKMY